MATSSLSKVIKQKAKQGDWATKKLTAMKEEALQLAAEAVGDSAAHAGSRSSLSICSTAVCSTANVSRQQAPLGFLDLPPEIWSKICKLAIKCDYPVLLRRGKNGGKKGPVVVRQPGITQVCRRVREECLPHFYAANEFGYVGRLAHYDFAKGTPDSLAPKLNALFVVDLPALLHWSRQTKVHVKYLTKTEARWALRSESNVVNTEGQESMAEMLKSAAQWLRHEPEWGVGIARCARLSRNPGLCTKLP